LNAYVVAEFARNPARTEEEIFNEFARAKMKLADADVKKFREMNLLSAKAVLRGQLTTLGARVNEWWARDHFFEAPDLKKTNRILVAVRLRAMYFAADCRRAIAAQPRQSSGSIASLHLPARQSRTEADPGCAALIIELLRAGKQLNLQYTMKLKALTSLLTVGALLAGNFTIHAAESPDPYANETTEQRDARMKWFREARFGMFIHWGVYAVPAGTYNGKQIGGIGEWIMNRGKIPMVEYQAYAKDFNPVKYNADEWVRLAKAAGMKYIVITSKHHDGFALFDSKVNDWDIAGATPYKKDLLKPLAEACRKQGLKLGFYYSQAQDWNNGGSAAGGKWDKAQEHSMDEYIEKVAVPQVREILTGYGKGIPAILWWDTPTDMNQERADKLIPLLKLQPGIIHNNRLGGGYKGDTETPEQYIPATGYPGRDWETCMTLNDTWGFKSYDHNWKSTETLVRNLVDIASKGGNYLLNIGPTKEGEIPEPSIERLKEIGAWMQVNGTAIYGTTATPFKRLPWGRCTTKVSGNETTLYLHVFNWPADGKLVVPGLKNSVKSARLLAGGKKLKSSNTSDGVVIEVPPTGPDKISSTVVLKIKGTPEIAVTPITQESDGSVRLMASEADLHGGLQYESGHGKDNIGFWTNPADSVNWTFKVDRPGKFKVNTDIAAEAAGKFEVMVEGQHLRGTAPVTKDFAKFKRSTLAGELAIPDAGNITLTVKPVVDGWHPMNLRSVTLEPVKSP
jgi:alpha-L-fucosidase